MASIIENLNSVITTKNQLNTILKENGQPGSEVFSEYPEQFRAAIAGAGTSEEAVNSYISSYLDTYNFIDADELSAMGYVTAADIPEVDLSSYVTYDYLSAQGYVTSVPVIDENIIPKETGTYTLGDSSYLYAYSYSTYVCVDGNNSGLSAANNVVNFNLNNATRMYVGLGGLFPVGTKQLGTNNSKWNITYTTNLYADTAYLQDTSYTKSIVPAENESYTLGDADHIYSASYTKSTYFTNNTKIVGSGSDITFYTGGLSRIKINNNILRPDRSGVNLGTSSNKWDATYTSNLYADTIHNFIWTGTSAEYAALDNYTTYQIYMIKES